MTRNLPGKTEPIVDGETFDKALDLLWDPIREHAYTVAKIVTVQSLNGSQVHGDSCAGCALAGSRGVFGGGVQAPMIVIVAVGQHTVDRLHKAMLEIERGAT